MRDAHVVPLEGENLQPAPQKCKVVEAGLHDCQHCGASFESRNALFRHLRKTCQPSLGEQVQHRKERVVLVIGYLGSRYRGCIYNDDRQEAMAPTVEGVLLAAVRRAWGATVFAVARSTRTEKGCHAAENVIVLTMQAGGARDDGALRRELQGSEIWLLAPAGMAAPPVLFDKVYAAKKRVFRVYIPYWAFRKPSTLDAVALHRVDSIAKPSLPRLSEREGEGLWICNVISQKSDADIIEVLQTTISKCGVQVTSSDIEFDPSSGHVLAHVSHETARDLCKQLDGYCLEDRHICALPLPEVRAKLVLQKDIRAVLKALRGPAKGLRSFHNFMPDGTAPGDAVAMRQLQKCTAASLENDLRNPGGQPGEGTWSENDWTYVSFSAADFGAQQVRRMAGLLVTILRGAEDLGYVHRCFSESIMTTVAAPAEAISLESVTFGQWDSDWRDTVNVLATETRRVHVEIETRIVQEALQPWRELVSRIDNGASRDHCNSKLLAAAECGCLDALSTALQMGACLGAADDYGRTAAFLAASSGHEQVLCTLAHKKADLGRPANGGSTPHTIAAARGHTAVLDLLNNHVGTFAGDQSKATCAQEDPERSIDEKYEVLYDEKANSKMEHSSAVLTEIIPMTSQVATSGAMTIDGAFSQPFIMKLETLWQKLPLAPKEKASPTERAYFADAEGWVTRGINEAMLAAGLEGVTLPLMRFLIYPTVGGYLPPHVDLSRIDEQGLRSTHTFLLYLTDCLQGGETRFLQGLDGDDALAPSGGLAPGEREVIAAALPRRGRLLLFPHAYPHEAAPIVEVPKVLVRGEVRMIQRKGSPRDACK